MHGRKKQSVPRSDEEIAALRKKGENYRLLSSHVLAGRKQGKPGDLKVIAKLLLANCDSYTMWNYRRSSDCLDDPERELDLTAECLKRNPKSYPTWAHRRWVVERSVDRRKVATAELDLCSKLLSFDERNFHCWNYRRQMSEWAQEENPEAFALSKLEANFSNYSAFHDRSARLPERLDATRAKQELDFVANALFIEPDDQSGWWYAECVLEKAAYEESVLEHQRRALSELRESEPRSKWPALALLRILKRQQEDYSDIHQLLLDVDPGHAGMYGALLR